MKHSRTFAILPLGLLCALGAALCPEPARAQVITAEPGDMFQDITSAISNAHNILKEEALDRIAWSLGEAARQAIVKSTVNWINSGFNGSPAFETDLKNSLLNVADAQANMFLQELESSLATDSPFRDEISGYLRDKYYRTTGGNGFFNKNAYTLDQVSPDSKAFLGGDFSQGGFNALFSALEPQNNPYGLADNAEKELALQVGGAQEQRVTELNWGDGFRSLRDSCDVSSVSGIISLSQDRQECLNAAIQTGGAVIKDQLTKALGSSVDKLVSADELNEIIDALLGQLSSKVLGTGGLAGLSAPASGGGRSAIDAATDASRAVSTTGASVAKTIVSDLGNQQGQVNLFQGGWERIGTATEAAATACASDREKQQFAQEIQAVRDRVSKNIAIGAAATESIQDLSARAASVGANTSTEALNALSSEYQDLLSSGLPDGRAITEAQLESQDSSGSGTPSLYARMREIAASCTALRL